MKLAAFPLFFSLSFANEKIKKSIPSCTGEQFHNMYQEF